MRAGVFCGTVTVDRSDFLTTFLDTVRETDARCCVIGGQGVNAYADPVVSLDLDTVVVAVDVSRLRPVLAALSARGAPAQPQRLGQRQRPAGADSARSPLSTIHRAIVGTADPWRATPGRGGRRRAAGKVWEVMDASRRAGTRQKDLADIARLLERDPGLRAHAPQAVLDRLL